MLEFTINYLSQAFIMDDLYKIPYDPSKEMQMIFDFHGAHILYANTNNPDVFLSTAREFDKEVLKRLGPEKTCKLVYLGDKTPPLTTLLKFFEDPFDVNWGVYAVIPPVGDEMAEKFKPVVNLVLGMSKHINKYAIRIFDGNARFNMKEVLDWMDQNSKKKVD